MTCDVLRLDLVHPEVSGNKWFKLKYNIRKAQEQKHHTVLTFGGAASNHIAATAVACKEAGLNSIGIIRGELAANSSLKKASENGMRLHPVTRKEYLLKNDVNFIEGLKKKFGEFYIVPEGG